MKIDTIVLGDFQTNCYCVRKDEKSTDCLIIDPGLEPEPLVQMLRKIGCTPTAIALTHGHVDHIGGVETIRQYWPQVTVTVHEQDAEMLTSPAMNLSVMAGCMVQARPAEHYFNSGAYQAAGLEFKVMHTPGHTAGGICLYAEKDHIVFAGDTLFAGSIGRTDFPGGSHSQLIRGIKEHLLTLPDDTTVYPGHGPATTIRAEKRYNSFLI